jgi:hypothetical protein
MVTPAEKTCAIALKEWAGVCDALLQGRQTIIVRKGGIAEVSGAGCFAPEYSEFWLYPTWSHQADQGLRESEGPRISSPPADFVPIRALVRVDFAGYVDDDQLLGALEDFHVLTSETMLKRFYYRRPGLWILGARVWRREPEALVALAPEHAGCKSWVRLAEPLVASGLYPVSDGDTWARTRGRLEAILDCKQNRRGQA